MTEANRQVEAVGHHVAELVARDEVQSQVWMGVQKFPETRAQRHA